MPDPSTGSGSPPAQSSGDWAVELRSRLSSLRLSPTREAEIVEELSQHLDQRWHELMASGVAPDEATRLALADLNGQDSLSRRLSSLRAARWSAPPTPGAPQRGAPGALWHDLRYAARVFTSQPGFAVAAVLTLALGIGAITAVFSVVYGVLLKPLPFPDAERLVHLSHRTPEGEVFGQGPDTYLTYRDHQRAFEAIGVWERGEVTITGRGAPEHVQALSVTAATLPLLRVQPALGTFFTSEDDSPGGPLRVVLAHEYWQRRFGGRTDVIGQSLRIDGQAAEVTGVLPRSFTYPGFDPAIVLPMPLQLVNGIVFDFQVIGRLRPGVSIADANADVARMIPLLHPSFGALRLQPQVVPLVDQVVGRIGRVLWILLAAMGVVLLVVCANVANLFLVRVEGRQRELAIRAALGAGRSRLARVLLLESLLLAVAGGVAGVALAYGMVSLLRTMAPATLPRVEEIGLNATVLLFALAVAILVGTGFGLVSLLKFGTPRASALTDNGRASSDTSERHRTRNALVVSEIALALVLMVASGLMIRTFDAMRHVAPGFTSPAEVQTFRITVPEETLPDDQRYARSLEEIARRLQQIPGVASVGLASSITMDGEDNSNPLYVEDHPAPGPMLTKFRRFKSVAPGYFEAMGNRVIAGRPLTWSDSYDLRPVIVVSEALAREYWKEPSRALGKRVRGSFDDTPWRDVVGVVGDERDDGLAAPPTAIAYWPVLNDTYQERTMSYVVRSRRVGTPGLLADLQQAVWSVHPDVALANVQTAEEIRLASMAQTSFVMTMLTIAAVVALVLSLVGIYAVVAYSARQRTREIGIRTAIGAQLADVRRLFLRHGLRLTAYGIALGLAGAVVLTRGMSALLFGVGALDAGTFLVVSVLMALVALAATYLPARRASRVDPVVALRGDT